MAPNLPSILAAGRAAAVAQLAARVPVADVAVQRAEPVRVVVAVVAGLDVVVVAGVAAVEPAAVESRLAALVLELAAGAVDLAAGVAAVHFSNRLAKPRPQPFPAQLPVLPWADMWLRQAN